MRFLGAVRKIKGENFLKNELWTKNLCTSYYFRAKTNLIAALQSFFLAKCNSSRFS